MLSDSTKNKKQPYDANDISIETCVGIINLNFVDFQH